MLMIDQINEFTEQTNLLMSNRVESRRVASSRVDSRRVQLEANTVVVSSRWAENFLMFEFFVSDS